MLLNKLEDFAYNKRILISTYLETLIKQKWFQVELSSVKKNYVASISCYAKPLAPSQADSFLYTVY